MAPQSLQRRSGRRAPVRHHLGAGRGDPDRTEAACQLLLVHHGTRGAAAIAMVANGYKRVGKGGRPLKINQEDWKCNPCSAGKGPDLHDQCWNWKKKTNCHLCHKPRPNGACLWGHTKPGKAELAALRAALPDDRTVSLHPLKPFTGHTVGASGVLDVAILARYLRDQQVPPNLPGNTCPGAPFSLTPNKLSVEGSTVLKISVGMGGHNSIISLRSPAVS